MSLYRELIARINEGEFNYAYSISLKHKYVYVENAKAACSTLKSILGEWEFSGCSLGEVIPQTFLSNVHVNVLGTPFVKPFQLGEQAFNSLMASDEYVRFSFVRNPYVRLLSGYLDKIVRRAPESVRILEVATILGLTENDTQDLSFLGFLKCIEFMLARGDHIDKHWRSQHQQLHPDAIRYGFVGRVENLEGDMARLATLLGFDMPQTRRSFGHETGASSELAKYYTDESSALLYKLYESDFVHFGYNRLFEEQEAAAEKP
jgi:Sulfotransferase family